LAKTKVIIYSEYCKGCGICIDLCPMKILDKSKKMTLDGYYPPVLVEPEKCTGCRVCEIVCPDIAVDVVVVK